MRWPNLLLMALQLVAYQYFLSTNVPNNINTITEINFIFYVIGVLAILAAGNVINDIHDVEIDKINNYNNVIIDKYITHKQAKLIYTFLNIVGLISALFINLEILFYFGITILLLYLYTPYFKPKPLIGNILISLLAALSIFLLSKISSLNIFWINFYALFAFGCTLIREIIKDMEDMQGDKALHLNTLPIVMGIRATKMSLNFLLFLIFFMLTYFYIYYKIPFHLFTLLIIAFILFTFQLNFAKNKTNYTNLSQSMKWLMLLGITGLVLI